jgi:hypothetical protein
MERLAMMMLASLCTPETIVNPKLDNLTTEISFTTNLIDKRSKLLAGSPGLLDLEISRPGTQDTTG